MPPEPYGLAILGGGPAGMSAALVAGRSRLRAIVLNEEKPRNAVATASHGFLTRDGIRPQEMLRIAKEQLAKYPSVAYHTARVERVADEGGAFTLRLASGEELRAARLILAAGQRDELDRLGLPGIRDVYGTSVHPCPFCDGFEHSGKRLAIFGAAGVESHAAVIRMWSDDVAVFTNGRALEPAAKEALARNGVPLYEAKVLALESQDGRLVAVRLEGERVERDAGFLWDRPWAPASDVGDALGLRRKEMPYGIVAYEADEFGRTNVPRVYVVGDLRSGFGKVAGAVADGSRCVEGIVHELARERWR